MDIHVVYFLVAERTIVFVYCPNNDLKIVLRIMNNIIASANTYSSTSLHKSVNFHKTSWHWVIV